MGENPLQQILTAQDMRITLVGAGNVAVCMSPALKSAGHSIAGVYSRTEVGARTLADSLGTKAVTDLEELPEADVYLTMLRDDVLPSLAERIVRNRQNALFLHTSGSVPMSVWKDAGASHYGVLYPMQTFSRGKKIGWGSVPIFTEASGPSELETVNALAGSLSGQVRELDSEKRGRMHLAAVFACNFTNRMYAISEKLLEECGIPFDVMLPLINETAEKVSGMAPEKAQTGPAVRGDERVLELHRRLLDGHPEWLRLYELISKDINRNLF